ncbi:hypothetical protein [Neisseria sicca]|uniref:hypothetical protein n=1 Tax=Neisseria sicca TaxID=490 RepID=UPI000B1CE223|nr:hypothetical protein [Neisseria sicca]QTM23020.1 hypothetical protein J7445_11080 [Neisseria sicca]
MKYTLSLLMILTLSACGVVGNTTISDNSLKNKAAFALNVPAESISISNRHGDIDSVKFVATTGDKSYSCYVTTVMGAVSSDALCSGSNVHGGKGSRGGSSCNALLKAAGRC